MTLRFMRRMREQFIFAQFSLLLIDFISGNISHTAAATRFYMPLLDLASLISAGIRQGMRESYLTTPFRESPYCLYWLRAYYARQPPLKLRV